MKNALKPKFRYSLKAEIIGAGYKTLTDFANAINADLPRLSRIVTGWEIPGPGLQQKIAKSLGISLKELKGLL